MVLTELPTPRQSLKWQFQVKYPKKFCHPDPEEPFSTVIIILSAQTFFAWRVHTMTGSWLYIVLIMVSAITSALGGFLTGIDFVRNPNFRHVRESTTFTTLWLVAGVVCDVLIVVIRLWYTFLFGSSLLSLLVAAADLIVYMILKGSGMHLILNLPLCKLFSSNVMHCLNSRHGVEVRWSSEIIPHTLYRTEDVRPGDAIEFANVKTTMRSDDASELQSQFGDAETPDSPTAIINESEEYRKHRRWSAV
ncbi:hypothetical protein BJ912DRAFT_923639 [Pholiota molesta]|nr:hypothetical protein BJ912DRAFT_923639 [Pholiota molesta]